MKTIKDLLDWAIEHNALNLALSLQYEDGGGYYPGHTLGDGEVVRVSLATDNGNKFILLS
nr:MAG TPA: hypothetical protein [Caudoviricetes sp.]